MPKRNELLDAALAEIEAAGMRAAVQINRHIKIWIIYGERKHLLMVASTASDWRAVRNVVSRVRRITKGLRDGTL